MIVNLVAHDKSFDAILEEYPDLELADIHAALNYAAWLARDEVYPAVSVGNP